MKRCRKITCWTDYPFVELGDEPHKPALIRRVRVVSYNGDKYASIVVAGVNSSVKWGYLYRQAGRHGYVKTINRRKLERMISDEQTLVVARRAQSESLNNNEVAIAVAQLGSQAGQHRVCKSLITYTPADRANRLTGSIVVFKQYRLFTKINIAPISYMDTI